MKPRVTVITLGVDDLERSVCFYRDGLGLRTDGIVGSEFPDGAVAFFDLENETRLALWPRKSLANDSKTPEHPPSPTEFSLGHNVSSRLDVDDVMELARRAGAIIVKPAQGTFWGGYAGYFQDPDGHLWEVVWNPQLPVPDPLADERAIRDLEAAYDAAWQAGDVDALVACLSEDVVVVNPLGEVSRGREEVSRMLRAFHDGPARGSTHTSRILRVEFVAVSVAVVDGEARVERPSSRGEPGASFLHRFTDIVVRSKKGWEIAQIRACGRMALDADLLTSQEPLDDE